MMHAKSVADHSRHVVRTPEIAKLRDPYVIVIRNMERCTAVK